MGYGDIDRAVSQSQFLRYAEDLAAVYDMERQRRTQLKQVYEDIANIVHMMQEGALITNNKGVVREVNQAACDMLDMPRARMLGGNLEELFRKAGASHSGTIHPAQTPFSANQVQTIILSSGRIIRSTCCSMKNNWTLCMLRDATKEVQMENIKQDFFALLSHELRTPLTGVLGFTELLMSQQGSNPALEAEALKSIHESGLRMFKIVDELLRFASLQGERHEMQQEPLQVPLLIRSVFELLEPVAERRNISLFIDHDQSNPVILRGNSAMLREMLRHIIQNSIVFGKENGNVAIRVRQSQGKQAVIEIEDDGIGIPSNLMDKVFDSFYQVEDTLSRRHQGLGLGLSIARIIARIHGGSISLSSEVGQGTTCTITLPMGNPAPERNAQQEVKA